MDKELFLQKLWDAEETLFHVAFSILHNEQDCADAVQEAILKAYDARDKLRNEAFFKTWIVRIVINECYAILRSVKRLTPYEEARLNSAEYIGKYVKEEYLDLYRAVSALDDKHRICVILYYFEEYSVEQIAQITQVPAGTVKSRSLQITIRLHWFWTKTGKCCTAADTIAISWQSKDMISPR